jgi:signal transduction histidine kinase
VVCVSSASPQLARHDVAKASDSKPPFVQLDRDPSGGISQFVTPERTVAYGKSELAVLRLNRLVEQQSARLADMLHDDAGQVLASAHMEIQDVACDVSPSAQARLQQVRQHLHDVAEQLRRVSQELHPSIVDDLGLSDAITFISRTFTRRTGVKLAINVRLDGRYPTTLGAVVYRFLHEALTNIDKHAQATSASIAIAHDGGRLLCAVCDDGVGFDVAATLGRDTNRGLGLVLIRARLEAIGGTLDITSAPQQGTRLHAAIPLEP